MAASATIAAMRSGLARERAATPDALRRVDAAVIGETLVDLGLSDDDAREAVHHWGEVVASEEWTGLLAGVLAMVERQRGQIDEPIAIWDDLDDAGPVGRLFYIYLVALASAGTRAFLRRAGFSEVEVRDSLATFARHVSLHRRKHASLGVDAGWWMVPLLRGELVSVGSLQYHRVTLGVGSLTPSPWYEAHEIERLGVGFAPGDPSIGLHIPDGADLSPPAVTDSLERARTLFERTWPVAQRRLVTCQSWMLDDRLRDWIGEGNLVAFQRRFTLVDRWHESDEDVREFVFRPRESARPTALQNAVTRLLDSGGHWRNRIGWIAWDGCEC
ncbi:MAG: DUF5596 domain-containing protein [Acidobacteriota bacterium]|nr:DUF5596 domain-containing protein [Acidobacteriota bacterium]